MILNWTACLFATVVLQAHYVHNAWYHCVFLAITVMSLLRWSDHNTPVITTIDKIAAHLGMALVLSDTMDTVALGQTWLLLFPLTVSLLWIMEIYIFRDYWRGIHAALHVVAAVGANAYLHVLAL